MLNNINFDVKRLVAQHNLKENKESTASLLNTQQTFHCYLYIITTITDSFYELTLNIVYIFIDFDTSTELRKQFKPFEMKRFKRLFIWDSAKTVTLAPSLIHLSWQESMTVICWFRQCMGKT